MTQTAAAQLDPSTRLSVTRTILSLERTLMSWVRTAVALISFGFTIYKFFAFEAGRNLPATGFRLTPRAFAMIMIGMGIVSLCVSTIAHQANMKRLQAEYGVAPRYSAFVVASIVSILGLLAFVAALLRA